MLPILTHHRTLLLFLIDTTATGGKNKLETFVDFNIIFISVVGLQPSHHNKMNSHWETLCFIATLFLMAASNPVPTSIITQTAEVEYVTEVVFEVVTESTIQDEQPTRTAEETEVDIQTELAITEKVAEVAEDVTTRSTIQEVVNVTRIPDKVVDSDIATESTIRDIEMATETYEYVFEQTELVTEIITGVLSDRTMEPQVLGNTVNLTPAPVHATSIETETMTPESLRDTITRVETTSHRDTATRIETITPLSQRDTTTTQTETITPESQRNTHDLDVSQSMLTASPVDMGTDTPDEPTQTEIIEVTELVDITDDPSILATESTERIDSSEETTEMVNLTENSTTKAPETETKPPTQRPRTDTSDTGVIIDIIINGQDQAHGPGYETNGDTGGALQGNGHHYTYDVGTGTNGHVQVLVHVDPSQTQL